MSSIGLMGGPRGFNWVIKGQQGAKRSKGDQGVQGDPNVLSNGPKWALLGNYSNYLTLGRYLGPRVVNLLHVGSRVSKWSLVKWLHDGSRVSKRGQIVIQVWFKVV